jgi:hypothetical protein
VTFGSNEVLPSILAGRVPGPEEEISTGTLELVLKKAYFRPFFDEGFFADFLEDFETGFAA